MRRMLLLMLFKRKKWYWFMFIFADLLLNINNYYEIYLCLCLIKFRMMSGCCCFFLSKHRIQCSRIEYNWAAKNVCMCNDKTSSSEYRTQEREFIRFILFKICVWLMCCTLASSQLECYSFYSDFNSNEAESYVLF